MKYALGLGSNVGDRLEHLRAAVRAVSELGSILSVSALYETEPVGGPEQGRFLNAVVVIESALTPEALLAAAQRVEANRDRTREVRWGPRTLDIDILVAERHRADAEELTIPHPRARERRFVLAPLAQVWPDAQVDDGVSASVALRGLSGQPVFRWSGDWVGGTPGLGGRAKAWVFAQLVSMAGWAWLAVATGKPSSSGWVLATGLVLAAAGGLLGFRALRLLGSDLSAYPQAREGADLVAIGPYRLVRHPIYGAILLGAAGVSLAQESWLAALGVLALGGFFWAKSTVEERSMMLIHPGYGEYRDQVRRRLIPWVA